MATASLALIALVIGLTWRQRSRTRTNPLSPDALRAQALYRVMERRLARVGVPRPPARTPTRHAESLVREGRAGADVVTAITEAYVAARFGTAGLSASDAKRWRRRLHEVR